MAWTDKQEREWKRLSRLRQKNQVDINQKKFIQSLRDVAKSIEQGNLKSAQWKTEWIRRPEMGGFPPGPVIGHKITILVPVDGHSVSEIENF